MPEGFDPHRELARIQTLREVMIGCARMSEDILLLISNTINDPEVDIETRLRAADMAWNRAYGKPRQSMHVTVADVQGVQDINTPAPGVTVYIPDNKRNIYDSPVIDQEAA
jgi:hypothetical protein